MLRRSIPYWGMGKRGGVTAIPFISLWRTTSTSTGSSASNQVKLPLISLGTYDFIVDWGDSTSNTITVWNQAETTHTYGSTGDYTITITGVCIGWQFGNLGDRLKIRDISQWGSLRFVTQANQNNGVFRGCANLQITATDYPDLSGGIACAGFFFGCTALTGNSSFANWNTTGVTNMSHFFASCSNFNVSLANWDTSSVIIINRMFNAASIFNQNINSWDVSNVTNFESMFLSATAFNGNITSWNTGSATDMQGMFTAATNFNQNISSWNVSNVTTFGSANLGMFRLATNFNQNIGGWNVGSATSFRDMFSSATNFNQNIGSWNMGLGTDFTNFMAGKTNLNYSAANLDAIYNEWTNRSLQTGRTITFNTIKRTASSTPARDLLTRTNTTVSISNAVNNGSGLIRITSAAHGRTTGEKIFISGVLGTTEANGGWIVTVIDATTLDLQGSTFTNTYTSGGTLRTGYGWSVTDGGI